MWLAGKGRYCRQADLVSVLTLSLDRCAILDLTELLNCLSCKMRMLRTYFRGVMKRGGCHSRWVPGVAGGGMCSRYQQELLWKQPKCPLMDGRVNTMWYSHTME